jgi:ribosome maturation factor RimP
MSKTRTQLQVSVEEALESPFPEVEVVDVEVRGGPSPALAVFIDKPGGVDLELCAAVSAALSEVREKYALEVSSPGLDRRLRKPRHFAEALGREVVVKTAEPLDGRRSFRGTITAADDATVTLALSEGGEVSLPIAGVAKANVVYNFDSNEGGGHRE